MKTVSVTASLSRNAGGLFTSVRKLHQALVLHQGVSVDVFGVRDDFTDADKAEWLPLNVRAFPTKGPRPFGWAPGLKTALREGAYDILHTHGIWMYSSLAALDWHRRTRRPYVISPHGMLDPWAVRNSAWKKRIAHAFYEGAHLRETACIRALCESEARAIRNFGLKNPIAIIPNGIDLENVDGSQTKGAPWAEVVEGGKRVLLFLGRIHPKKGLVNLLKAWGASQSPQQSNAKAAEWVLAIAGWDQGGHEAELKRICTGLGIAWADMRAAGAPEPGFSDRLGSLPSGGSNSSPGSAGQPSVVFLGPQFSEAKALCYAKCDAFILPSFSEGLPMVILEAWAHRKPVLMTPECNLPEGVAANAAICFETDVENVLGGLRSLFEMTDEERLEMGVRGHELASKRFDWDQIAHETKVLYEWVLGGGQKPDCLWEDSV